MSVSLKLDKHLNNLGYYLLEGYLLFPALPRNVGSITSVNEHEHFNKRLTIFDIVPNPLNIAFTYTVLADLM